MIIEIADKHDKTDDDKIWDLLYHCTLFAVQDGIWLKLTDPHPFCLRIGVIFRTFGKEDVPDFLRHPENRLGLLSKNDPDRMLWEPGDIVCDFESYRNEVLYGSIFDSPSAAPGE